MIEYIIYWLVGTKHCDAAAPIKQVDGKIAWVCRHNNIPTT